MTTDELYLASPIWLQCLFVAAYGYVLRRRRFGGAYKENLESLLKSQYRSADAMRELQQRRLTAIVAHAFEHVPHYRDMARRHRLNVHDVNLETLSQTLPILEKHQIRAEPSRFISEAPPGKLLTINTSGTTGSPLRVACTLSALRENYAFFSRFLVWHGLHSTSRTATFAGRTIVPQRQEGPPFWRPNPAFRNLQFSSYHLAPKNLPHYLQKLAEWSPDLIDTYPSSGTAIANFVNSSDQSQRVRPKAVITSSETLMDHQRVAMEEAFGCPVRDQYGSAEMVAFAAECEYGTIHAAPEYGVLEIISGGATSDTGGKIIATGFINSAMPLLRYDTGDLAASQDAPCPCGRNFPSIARILGRNDDIIVTPEGARIGRLDPIFKGATGILECQIVQQQLDRVTIRAVLAQDSSQEVLVPVMQQLARRLPPSMTITCEVVDNLQRSSNGKLRAVVSMIKNS